MLGKENKDYIESQAGRELTVNEINKIEKHLKRYDLNSICAYYYDWDDFCSDWCDEIGYTKTEARSLLHGGKGEFQTINGLGILRFEI